MTETLARPVTLAEHGDFALDAEARTVTGLLVPWGEKSRLSASQTEPIAFERGTVAVPRDVTIVGANRRHDRFDPVARATSIEDTERGLVGVFAIANTDEGDALIREHAEGKLRKLSPELAGIVRDATDKSRGIAARLVGAGFVEEGAFASAGLFALGDIADELAVDALTPVDGRIEVVATETPEVVVVTVEDRPTEFTPTPTPDAPAETERAAMAVATAPNTAQLIEDPKPLDANGVFELITAVKSGAETEDMLAALADIKISGTGALPAAGVLQPSWLGEVWAGVERSRRYAPLIKNGTIVSLEEKGFKLSTGGELVKSWSGNKTELPTGTATTSLVSGETLQKWGFAADIAREFYDIPAGKPIVDAFIREILRSFARVTDKYVLERLYAGAGTAIAAAAVPSGYDIALGKLVQGIDLVDDSDVTPTFAIVAPDVWKSLRMTPFEKIPQYITFSAGRQEGTADGVTVVRDKAGVLAAGQVLVGSRDAAHINEIGGDSPIQLDALDLARGGIDRAVVGYSQYMTEYPDGLRLIGNA